jgi:hypothetical protein
MSDRDLDYIFKNKLTNREFEFNPASWEAMESLLDAEQKKSAYYLWTSAAIVAFGLFVASLLFIQNPGKIAPQLPITHIENSLSQPESILDTQNDRFSEEDIEKEDLITNPVSEIEIPQETSSAVSQSSPLSRFSESNGQTEPNPTETNTTAFVDDVEEVNDARSYLDNSQPIVAEENLANAQNDSYISVYKGIPSLISSESPSNLFTNRVRTNFIRRFQKQHEVWLQAGPDFSQSTNDNSLATGWMLGVNYQYRFSYLWSMSAGLNYSARTSLGISHSSDSVFYSFGQEIIRTEVENKRLDYFELPIELNYTLNGNHQFGAGAYVASLFNVNTTVNKTHFDYKGSVNKTVFDENRVSENFNQLDYGFTASYFYQYNPALSMGIQFKQGLADITRNRTTELNDDHRNVQTRFILRYRLF